MQINMLSKIIIADIWEKKSFNTYCCLEKKAPA